MKGVEDVGCEKKSGQLYINRCWKMKDAKDVRPDVDVCKVRDEKDVSVTIKDGRLGYIGSQTPTAPFACKRTFVHEQFFLTNREYK